MKRILVAVLLLSAGLARAQSTTTSNMRLVLPVPGLTPSPLWAPMLITAMGLVDTHDHTPGKGVRVPVAGLNINADFPLNGFNLTLARSLRVTSQSSALTGPFDLRALYSVNGDLYWNNGSGTAVQLTAGSGLNAASIGGIGGDYVGSGASVYYTSSSKAYSFTSSTGVRGGIEGGPFYVYDPVSSGKYVRLGAPSGLAANYSLTLPTALPASTLPLLISTTGQVSPTAITGQQLSLTLPGSTMPLQVSSGGAFTAAQVTGAQIASKTIAAGNIADGTLTNANQGFGTPSATTDVAIKSYVDSGQTNTAFSGKPTATATVSGDGSTTLTTKGYVDGGFLPISAGMQAGNSNLNLELVGQADTIAAPSSTWGRISNRRSVVSVSGSPAIPDIIDGASGIALPLFGLSGWSNTARGGCTQNAWASTLPPDQFFAAIGSPGAAQSWSSATLKGRVPRIRYTPTGGADGGTYQPVTAWRGNAAGAGGFAWWAEWGLGGTVNVNERVIVGLAAAPSTVGTSPNTKADTVYFGCNTDDNLQICSNDNVGSATCSDLGVNFPCANGAAQNTLFRSAIWAAPNGSTISWAIERLDAGPYTANGTLSSDLPRNTVQLGQEFGLFESASGTSSLDFIGACLFWNP